MFRKKIAPSITALYGALWVIVDELPKQPSARSMPFLARFGWLDA
jgi:hypothetical protein